MISVTRRGANGNAASLLLIITIMFDLLLWSHATSLPTITTTTTTATITTRQPIISTSITTEPSPPPMDAIIIGIAQIIEQTATLITTTTTPRTANISSSNNINNSNNVTNATLLTIENEIFDHSKANPNNNNSNNKPTKRNENGGENGNEDEGGGGGGGGGMVIFLGNTQISTLNISQTSAVTTATTTTIALATTTTTTILSEMSFHQYCLEHRNSLAPLFTFVLYTIVCIVGLFGNTLVIYVVLRFSKMQTVTNIYILNLAIADECFLIGIPFLLYTMRICGWRFGDLLCKAYMVNTSIPQFTSSIFLLIMSADRYIAVCHPITSPRYRTVRIAKLVSALAWLTSAVLMLPVILYASTVMQEDGVNLSCNIDWPETYERHSAPTFILYTFLLGFATPLTFILIFYCLVIRKLQAVGMKHKSKEKKRSHRKVTRLVLTVITVYILCWLPYWISQVALISTSPDRLHLSKDSKIIVFLLFGCLSYSNSAMNPILYAFLSDNFRKSFSKAFTCMTQHEVNAQLHAEPSVLTRQGSRKRQQGGAGGGGGGGAAGASKRCLSGAGGNTGGGGGGGGGGGVGGSGLICGHQVNVKPKQLHQKERKHQQKQQRQQKQQHQQQQQQHSEHMACGNNNSSSTATTSSATTATAGTTTEKATANTTTTANTATHMTNITSGTSSRDSSGSACGRNRSRSRSSSSSSCDSDSDIDSDSRRGNGNGSGSNGSRDRQQNGVIMQSSTATSVQPLRRQPTIPQQQPQPTTQSPASPPPSSSLPVTEDTVLMLREEQTICAIMERNSVDPMLQTDL